MAVKIIWNEKKKTPPTFDDIKVGELFTINQTLGLFMKIGDVYPRDELDHELNYEHELCDSEDIQTDFFNAIRLGSGELRFFDSFDSVAPVEAEIMVSSVF